ncbi:MAG: lipoprotein-releasing ABC transporter permease subunit [Thermodesulfovibrionia bacterium]|nr:lipoprotein-releasing ABC transporter permease subunit [Thermodesulfovibrionia bacterium]
MNLPYQFFIALRYFRSKKKSRGISLNTLISIGGVALGVMALIIVLAVMEGFQKDLQEKILGVNAHIVVQSYEGRISDHDSMMKTISAEKDVLSSSPYIYGQVMLRSGDRVNGVILKGIDPALEAKTTDVLNSLKEGSLAGLKEGRDVPEIIIGMELLRTLGAFVGDEIEMISPVSEVGPLGMIPKMKKFRIGGAFRVGMYEYDSGLAFINIKDAQKFLNYGSSVTGIEVRVNDIYKAEAISERIGDALNNGAKVNSDEKIPTIKYYAWDWIRMNRNLFSALKLEKIVMFIILTLVILVASFNIVSNLIMIVIEKSREIAILKAVGATSGGIMSIFMIHGLIIGVLGTAFGVAGGYIVCQLLKTYKFISLPADVYYLSYLPVRIDLFDFLIVPAAAILISFLATIYPSWQAAKLHPVEPLRYE